jgi:glycine dehydrogenase
MSRTVLSEIENFSTRHIGITAQAQAKMLAVVGEDSLDTLTSGIVPTAISRHDTMALLQPISEIDALAEMTAMANKNQIFKNYIGQGFYGTHTPNVIVRNVIENPAWYTAYTPYQAEVSQGRLEALVNFQTMICDLTAMPIANASMLDDATSCSEAVMLAKRMSKSNSDTVLVSQDCHPHIIEVIRTRSKPLGIQVMVLPCTDTWREALIQQEYFAVVAAYPATHGHIDDLREHVALVHAKGAAFIVVADILALTLLTPPGEWGADIVVGTTQRFGVPMGNGGPHAAFFACRDAYKRSMPGRLVGVSIDVHGETAYRLTMQTREQHIRREKATSNICTAQVFPAVIASMYAVYHGQKGLLSIARRVASLTAILAKGLRDMGIDVVNKQAFDTLKIQIDLRTSEIQAKALKARINVRMIDEKTLGVSIDETTKESDIETLWEIFSPANNQLPSLALIRTGISDLLPHTLRRTSDFLTHPVFNSYHSETEMLRYLQRLSTKDLALDRTMIPLGSCTMKLNATSEMMPITWPALANIHPFSPKEQRAGYEQMNQDLCRWLSIITGYAAVSLQPNAGSQGELAGLLAIHAYHAANGQSQRNICLIPSSAHGTNPASACMAGLQVVVTNCDAQGNIDVEDIEAKCQQYGDRLSCVMITYPSTHGVFEARIQELCDIVHRHGGRVYLDGANMNALVGLAAPGQFGGDVSHLNLHKTFCIPHGGGGPGVGPVCVVQDLMPYLPSHFIDKVGENTAGVGAISSAPLGNACVLPVSWMYIRMMGAEGLRLATQTAILSANYISVRLREYYPTLYSSANGRVGHECILDFRGFKETCGVMAEDVAKRLADYGFHAPTLSFPVPNTLMVEPTESESLEEIDRFISALIAIREEISNIENGHWPRDDNPLKNAPHTAESLLKADWLHPYSRELAAYPIAGIRKNKYWPPVGRIDNAYGDRNIFCSCPPVAAWAD